MNKIRRQFIQDTVERWQKNNPEEYKGFLDMMEWRRANLADTKHAELEGISEIRQALSIPEGIMNALSYVLDGVEEPAFCEPKGEMKWFVKKFPQYLLPTTY